jgi:lysophospholipase L1-like esterase
LKGAKTILGLMSLLVGLLVCEALLSWLKPQLYRRPHVWQFDSELGWEHIPGASGWLVKPEFEVEFRINADGLRDRDYSRKRPPQGRRLLVMGDSFAEGWGVQLEESVSKQLEKQVQKAAPDKAFEVINFGVAGYGTDQEMLLFEKLGLSYEPDQVLVLFYPNDLINNANRQGVGAERGYKPYFRLGRDDRLQLLGVPVKRTRFWDENFWASRPWQERLWRHLGQHWHLYALVDKALAPEIPRAHQQKFYENLYGTRSNQKVDQTWELTGKLLQAFHASVQRVGAEMLLVYVPAIVQIEDDNWRSKRDLHGLIGDFDLKRPNREIARFAARYGIPLLDLYDPFKRASEREKLYYRESHWNARGHALAANLIGDYLLEQGRLDPTPKQTNGSPP